MKKKITVGITDCSKYANYHAWFASQPNVTIVKLSYHDNNLPDTHACDGIVLTGGEDVHPRYYQKPEFLERCDELDERRDEFEWKVLQAAEQNNAPVLGICRGLQVANVYFGGTLLPHIPDYGKPDHASLGKDDRYHAVRVTPGSLLEQAVGTLSGEVNSAHHQGADLIGRGLVASAFSPDGIVEALEKQGEGSLAFLLLVQWHPERMRDLDNVFSRNIRQAFLDAVRAHAVRLAAR